MHGDKLPVYENGTLSDTKKDKKYFKKLRKQKDNDKKYTWLRLVQTGI